jgi:hypothetical protein
MHVGRWRRREAVRKQRVEGIERCAVVVKLQICHSRHYKKKAKPLI